MVQVNRITLINMDGKLRTASLVLAVLGLLDSIYLVWVKYTGAYALCGPIGDCESVNSSQYSEIFGIPIALLGAGAYVVMIVLLLLENRGQVWAEFGPMIVFGSSDWCAIFDLSDIYRSRGSKSDMPLLCHFGYNFGSLNDLFWYQALNKFGRIRCTFRIMI